MHARAPRLMRFATLQVSPSAAAFVLGLLRRDPGERMTMASALQHPWLPAPEEVGGEEAVAVPVGPPAAPWGLGAHKSVGGWRGSRVHDDVIDVLAAIDVPRRTARPSAAPRMAPAFERLSTPAVRTAPHACPRRSHGLGWRSHGPAPVALQSGCAGSACLRKRTCLQRCCMQAAIVPRPTDERAMATS